MISLVLALVGLAHASVDPDCQELADEGPPDDYSEQGQQDFLLNYFALTMSLSPLHGPMPYEAGHGSLGVDVSAIPPLGCKRRLVLDYTKTEDTNKAPALPRLRGIATLPVGGKLVPYVGVAYMPPITINGARPVVVSGEAGVGMRTEKNLEVGLRYHATTAKVTAEIASPFEEGDPEALDFYVGATFGVDAMVGYKMDRLRPYASVGFTDASTFFYIGDDGAVSNNQSPFAGVVGSAGLQTRLLGKIDLAGEFYTAIGYVYTGRLRVGYFF